MPFFDIYISQGSVVTCLRRGGIFKHQFVANLLLSPSVKKVSKSLRFDEVMGKSLVSCYFDWQYYLKAKRKTVKTALCCSVQHTVRSSTQQMCAVLNFACWLPVGFVLLYVYSGKLKPLSFYAHFVMLDLVFFGTEPRNWLEWASPTRDNLKTYLFYKSFLPQTFFLPCDWLHGLTPLLLFSEHICVFVFFSFIL